MKNTELVIVPTPGMGHLLVAGKLAKLIVLRRPAISAVVLVITDGAHDPSIATFVDSQSRDEDNVADEDKYSSRLTFLTLEGPTLPASPVAAPEAFMAALELHKPIVKRAVLERVGSGSARLAGFVLDMFCTPMIDVANELNVPSYMFFTTSAVGLGLFLSLPKMVDEEGVDLSDSGAELEVPGYRNRVPGKVIPAIYRDKSGGGCEMMLSHSRRFRESKGILVNSYVEFESHGLQVRQKEVEANEIPSVYPVGPILELDNKCRNGPHEEKQDSIMEWLEEQPPSSVVFLCFGSLGCFDEVQVKEIAHGLDRSGHRFLWSLRKPPFGGKSRILPQYETFHEALPVGFLERTAHRGKIIGWAPQVVILAHHSIGGFVTHCGWNSMLESLWFGIPIATWPLYAEQQLNAFQMVKELGVAVEIAIDYQTDWKTKHGNYVVTAEQIEVGVKQLMSMDEQMREKVREMSDKGRKALQDGGSSHYWLGRFITNVLDNVA